MPDSSNKGGRKPRVSDDDLLDVFRSTSDPVLSTAEVADAVPIKRRGTLNRLQSLEDAGDLESKQIGGRNTVWWLVDEED
jgi:GTP-sensing pleiotropic transcriptional regulator CodY